MADLIIRGRHKIAEIVGVTVNGLIVMEQRGLPVQKKTTEGNWYHLPSVVQWLKADQERQMLAARSGESVKDLFERRARAEARKAEIEVGKLENSVVEIELVRRGLEGVMINQRTIMMGVPAQIGRDIDEPEIRVHVVAIVERRIRETLEVLSSYDPVIESRDDDADGAGDDGDPVEPALAQAAPKAHHQPVGRSKTLPEPRRRGVRPVAERHRALPD